MNPETRWSPVTNSDKPTARASAPRRAFLATIIQWRSLKTRVTVSTLAVFVIGIWLVAYLASSELRQDVEALLGEQQFSTVALVAADIDHELADRLRALEITAREVTPEMLGKKAVLQNLLEQRPIFRNLFNGGAFITGADGTAIASIPTSVGRAGVNYLQRDHIAAALKEGKSKIGRPVAGNQLRSPLFGMATPIRDTQGRVIGAMVGVVDLAKPNFLDKITQNGYGKSGGFLLLAPQHNLIVTGTDKRRVMTAMQPEGSNHLDAAIRSGFEGSMVGTSGVYVEVLASFKRIPVAGWFLAATTPTAVAFAPIRHMQQHLLIANILLTLLAGGLIWWILQRQLAPILDTVKTLADLSTTGQPTQPLPIVRQDEIGELINGFNGLLQAIGQRTAALRESEARYRMLFDSIDEGFCIGEVVFDKDQKPVDFRFLEINPAFVTQTGLGNAQGKRMRELAPKLEDNWFEIIGAIALTGQPTRFENRAEHWQRWYEIYAFSIGLPEDRQVAILFNDITERRQADVRLHDEQNRIKTILDTVADPIFVKDNDHRIILANPAFYEIFAMDESAAIGKTLVDAVPPDEARHFLKKDRLVLDTGRTDLCEETLTVRGITRNIKTRKTRLVTDSGEKFIVGTIQDITERKRAEARLIDQIEELRRWQQVTLGREGRVLALKKELNNLLAEHGQPPRYPSANDAVPEQ